MEYIDQKIRLAEGFACGLTEFGNIMPNSWSKIPSEDKEDPLNRRVKNQTLSLSRQWLNLTMTVDEQRTGEIFLGYRALVTFNRHLTEKKKVCAPIFLEIIHKFMSGRILSLGNKIMVLEEKIKDIRRSLRAYYYLYRYYSAQGLYIPYRYYIKVKNKLIKRESKLKKRHRRCLKKLARKSKRYHRLAVLIEDIGFYKFSYELRDPQTNALLAENMQFVIPCDIPFEFDTRGERKRYALYSHSPQ